MKTKLINFQKKAIANAKNNPNFLLHEYYGLRLNFALAVLVSTIFARDASGILTAQIMGLLTCALVYIAWELIQRYILGGSNGFWEMLKDWLFSFWTAIPFCVMIPITFIYL